MGDVIHLLPDATANQIAAGEVVQRPASVVKELMENAVDADSKHIRLMVKDAGKTLIQITDDGKGMSETDARMCFERHATSKITSADDLFAIHSMGFRGEAVASIAAVAQVELKTKPKGEELGTLIRMEGGELKTQEAVACNEGTSIAVKNLFFNVPARRNFLKSDPVEMSHMLEEFKRIAIPFHNIAFSAYQNDMEVYNLPASNKLSQRLVNIFGKNYREQLIPCEEDSSIFKLKGYIGKPEFAKKTRGEQYFFVNNRFMRHNYFNHAVIKAYQNLLPDNRYPFYALFLDIDPKHVDVNIHPTKTEVKFDDERAIYSIIEAAVKKALGSHNITPTLDFESGGMDFSSFGGGRRPSHGPAETSAQQQHNQDNWQKLFEGLQESNLANQEGFEAPARTSMPARDTGAEGSAHERPAQEAPASTQRQNTFQLHNRYIISQVKSGMMLIDQQAAHERILYEKSLNMLERREGVSQQSLFPHKIELSASDISLIHEMAPEIRALGFDFEFFGEHTIAVNGIPADLPSGNEQGLLEELLEQFKHNQSQLQLERHENLARSLAKRSALKPGTPLDNTEMNTMIDQLFACQTPNYAPDGRATVVMMDMHKIASLFQKH